MVIIFDPAKNARNITERGLPFTLFEQFDFTSIFTQEDTRKAYGETRLRIFGVVEGRLYVAVVTPRGEDLRVISLRKANRKEVAEYERHV